MASGDAENMELHMEMFILEGAATPKKTSSATDAQHLLSIPYLCDFVLTLTKFLALPILIILAFQFCQGIINIYLTVIFINEHRDNLARKIASITMVLGWLLIRMMNILFILDVCDSTCAEANRIANVSHETWASGALNGFKEEFNIFSHRLLRKRLEIKLFGAIALNYELQYKEHSAGGTSPTGPNKGHFLGADAPQ
ncbi:hypothetical protein PV327_006941 [Microctonus hyperodae]|uniref:Uncharacterized protein n=1 Tax=Microctonus hyperodae TaxID=165561 RepID=A0AA39F5B9_MICHY|nr:hypothetical protein PV327_006941 [Microctonus hyperodae]